MSTTATVPGPRPGTVTRAQDDAASRPITRPGSTLVTGTGSGQKAARLLPWPLHELVRYAVTLSPLRQENARA
jgi:hypothetical protein